MCSPAPRLPVGVPPLAPPHLPHLPHSVAANGANRPNGMPITVMMSMPPPIPPPVVSQHHHHHQLHQHPMLPQQQSRAGPTHLHHAMQQQQQPAPMAHHHHGISQHQLPPQSTSQTFHRPPPSVTQFFTSPPSLPPPSHHHHHHINNNHQLPPQIVSPIANNNVVVPHSVKQVTANPIYQNHPQLQQQHQHQQQPQQPNPILQTPPMGAQASNLHNNPQPNYQIKPNLLLSPYSACGSIGGKSSEKDKTPMCLINELARYNKTSHQYRLTDESGPAHKKTFTVCLKLADKEEFLASGPSIKKAQHAAAVIALEKTQLKHPPPKLKQVKNTNITPTVELNALAMKRGEPTSYTFVESPGHNKSQSSTTTNGVKGSAVTAGTTTTTAGTVISSQQQQQTNLGGGFHNQRYHYQNGKVTSSTSSPPLFVVRLKVGEREFLGEGATAQAAKHSAATKALRLLKEIPLRSPSKVPLNPASLPFVPGGGPHQPVADQAVKTQPSVSDNSKTIANSNVSVENSSGSYNSCNNLDSLKSPISLVHEAALKRNLTVTFEVTRETGPPHMRNFITKCIMGDFVTEGEGNGKKASKKRSADLMLAHIKLLPPLASCHTGLPASAVANISKPKKTQSVTKKKTRNLIKLEQKTNPDFGQSINPISRLIQIQQAKREKEPEYTLVSEKGMPRRREFVMQVCVGSETATGSGPNKKLAKRAAAENILQALGYSRPQPLLPKPAIKHSTTNNSNQNESNSTKVVNDHVPQEGGVQQQQKKQGSCGGSTSSDGVSSSSKSGKKLTFVDEIDTTTSSSTSNRESTATTTSTPVISIANGVTTQGTTSNLNRDQNSSKSSPKHDNSNVKNGSKETVIVSVSKDDANAKPRMNVNCQVFTPKTNGHATTNGNRPIVSASILNDEEEEEEENCKSLVGKEGSKKINGKISDLIQNSKLFQKNKQKQQQQQQQQQLLQEQSQESNILLNGVVQKTNIVQSKRQLEYLASVLGLTVTFQDFPKKSNNSNKTEYFSLVTIATNPPQVSHGVGPTIEDANNAAATAALAALADSGVECKVTGGEEKKSRISLAPASSSSTNAVSSCGNKNVNGTSAVPGSTSTASAAASSSNGRAIISVNAKKKSKATSGKDFKYTGGENAV